VGKGKHNNELGKERIFLAPLNQPRSETSGDEGRGISHSLQQFFSFYSQFVLVSTEHNNGFGKKRIKSREQEIRFFLNSL